MQRSNIAINEMLSGKSKSKYLDKEGKLTNDGIIKLREEFIKLWSCFAIVEWIDSGYDGVNGFLNVLA